MANIVTRTGVEKDGKIIIPCEFDRIKPAIVDDKESEELYITYKDDGLGIAKVIADSPEKNMYTDNDFCYIGKFRNSVAIVAMYCERFGTKYGIIDTDFNEQLECIYDEIKWLNDELLSIWKNGKYGIFSLKEMSVIISTAFKGVTYSGSNHSDDGTGKIILEI